MATSVACTAAAAEAEGDASISGQASLTGSFLAGQFARSSGDIDGAIRFLRRVYRTNSEDTEIAGQLVSMLLLDGQVREAAAIATKLPKSQPVDPLILLVQVVDLVKHQNLEEALRKTDDAFESGVGQVWLPLVAAWIDISLHPPKEPIEIQQLSGNLTRSIPVLYYHLALMNEYAGFTDEAARNFKSAIDNPRNPPVRVMQQMVRFYEQNGSPQLLMPLVQGYQNSADPSHGAAITKPDVYSGIAEVLFSMGSIMRSAGITYDAVAYLQLSLHLKENTAAALMSLADAYSDVRLYEQANRYGYAKVPHSDALFADAQIRLSINLDRMGNLSAALQNLDKFSSYDERGRLATVTRGDLLRNHGRCEEAIASYTSVLNALDQLSQEDWALLFSRAVCYDRTKQWDDAENDLLKALVLAPDQPDLLNYLGYSWIIRGVKLEEASAMIEKAVKARPNDPQILDSMGWSLFLRGRYGEAADYMERAVSLLPGDPAINDHLGDIYWKLGRKTEARFQWQRALNFQPAPELARMIESKIQSGLEAAMHTSSADSLVASEQGGADAVVR